MSLAVILPVRDGGDLLGECLRTITAEVERHEASLIVVDDASTDGTPERAEAIGATVIRHGNSKGPYVARNTGWQSTAAEVCVFTDIRVRPDRGWLSGLVRALEQPGAAVVGGDVRARTGTTAAQRFVHRVQPLMPREGLSHEFLPFLPTCNLATRRATLEAVDGFRPLRSGGDLDFCWRVQLAGLGSVCYAADAGVDWVPRRTTREVVRQWYRYGAAKPTLYRGYAGIGLPAQPPTPWPQQAYREFRWLVHGLRTKRPREWDVEVVDRLTNIAWWLGYRREWNRQEQQPDAG